MKVLSLFDGIGTGYEALGYTEGVSDNQRIKALGNGMTCDVIAHILSYIPDKN